MRCGRLTLVCVSLLELLGNRGWLVALVVDEVIVFSKAVL